MAKKKLSTLVKELEFEFEYQYYDYLIDSYMNGNFTSCRRLFSEMKKDDQKVFIKYCDGLNYVDKAKDFYFNLL